tara:strand:+ start:41 stop:493 length:453 start_codon:yes stop_codon:yes gene_type:complete
MNTKNVVFNKLFKDKTKPLTRAELSKKKLALGLVDDFTYSDAEGLRQEVSNLQYFTQEWFPQKFDRWYDLGREIYSIYFQRGEALITQTDIDRDKEILDKILESANDLGLDVNQIYPNYDSHREVVDEGIFNLEKFEEQKQEFENESKSV